MTQTDPISDLLTRVRNATLVKHRDVSIPLSRMKVEIAKVLKEEGYKVGTYMARIVGDLELGLWLIDYRRREKTLELTPQCG